MWLDLSLNTIIIVLFVVMVILELLAIAALVWVCFWLRQCHVAVELAHGFVTTTVQEYRQQPSLHTFNNLLNAVRVGAQWTKNKLPWWVHGLSMGLNLASNAYKRDAIS